LASILPLLDGEDFASLVADIKAHGLREPVIIYEDMVLDGRNRLRACEAAGVEPTFSVYQGDDPVAYIVSLNLRRRHLDESQRAMVAAKLATLKRGNNQHSPIGETSQAKAAELLNVGKRSVERAAEVRDHGAPELVSAVEQCKVSVSAAAAIASQSIEEQREILALVEPKLILKAAQAINARKAEKRHAERIAKLVELSKGNQPLNLERAYPVILADPPWQYRAVDISFPNLAPENHYPTISTEEIAALSVANLATPDAILFLWSTSPHLLEALQVMTAWGFQYQASVVWVKNFIGLGYWIRSRHEFLLIGSRGNMPHPAVSARSDSAIDAPRRGHSRKPDEAYELIERMYPELPKIELFARHTRAGWLHGETKCKQRRTMAFLIFCGAGPTQASEKGFTAAGMQ
jgi:N6-adenosine-specific RNA methylase IME4/ParB-like chromosome segregation protein Spo0J